MNFSGKKVMASALVGIVAAGMLVSPAYAGTAKTAKTTKSAKSEKKEETRNGFQLDDKTGEWHMYVDGEIAKDYYGIDQNIYGWWRIEQGDVNFDSMSVEANPYGWWKLNGGKVDFDYTGLAANEYGWWYIHEGMVDFDHFGLEQNEYGWFRIESGKVNFDFNGLAANEYGWWYLQGGRVDFDYTGLAANENGTWYVRNGQIDFSYNGHVKIDGKQYLVKGGQVSQEAYIWPLDGYTRLSDTFGERICPFHGKEFHNGVDIPAPGGTNIMASASGVVTKATYSSSFGNNITIDHGNGVETMYLHCSALAVEEGDHVEQGQVIAYVGTTGSSTGNHLDFRFKVNGEYVDPLSMVQP